MVTIIICIILAFALIVLLFNWDKVKSLFKSSPKEKTPKVFKTKKIDYDKNASKSSLNYDEKDFNNKKVDNLNREDDGGMPFVLANEDEMKELTKQPKVEGGRLRNSVSEDNLPRNDVQVEDLGEYEEAEAWEGDDLNSEQEQENDNQIDEDDIFAFLNDDYESQNSISEQIKQLSPEMKALLLTNVLDKKNENK